ncbi:hypothetical protein H0H81_009432 [Sphagnurus paluster]|uniref:Uncharacterized protein n=1 Tax=Sphagnurus paluster TaxID=117069 RepID=A0A9P7FRL9_9AGAR|nr:hypothetical protein H0H81_009432 [Sphagnurus paluster]
MAVLAPPDWQQLYPARDSSMDVPAANNVNSRQRASPANDSQQNHTPQHHHPQQHQHQHQPTFSYPVQQPQGSWTPSITAAPFYPSFYQNHQQQQQPPPQPYPPQIPQQSPYFDPANAQLAQWAYQQMMFNAQHGFPPPQRNASASDYFAQNIPPSFNPFPSGTPPPHQSHRGGAGDHQQQPGQQQGQFNGFHPYRRPARQPTPLLPEVGRAGVPGPPPNPPYKRPEASGSTSSVNSSSSQRQRTNSIQSGHSGHNPPSSVNGSVRSRNASPSVPASRNTPSPASSSGSAAPGQLRVPHHRASSSTSSNSSVRPSGISPAPSASTTTTTSPATVSSAPATAPPAATPRPARPSPLSQGNFIAERRMSRDDSDPMLDPTPSASMLRSGGLKGRLRRALSFNVAQSLKEEAEQSDDESIKASSKSKTPAITSAVGKSGAPVRSSSDGNATDDSMATGPTKKKGRAASLFNARLNASTDNISLSSTVSSASVMIRKLGSMGKLAKRNSLAGITSLFKDKDKSKKKDKDKKGAAKAEASEASVSHVTAELDRTSTSSDWTVSGMDMNGLSPAAKLARQHTLKSNAEAAARAKAAQEAAVASSNTAPPAATNGTSGAGVPTWDKNTATRQASPVKRGSEVRVNEDGTRVLVEDTDEESDEGNYDGPAPGQAFHAGGWGVDDEDWDGEGDGDEDMTIRVGLQRTGMDDEGYDDVEPWAVNARRSVEKARLPAKGILKYADSYDQQIYLTEAPNANRLRSNSYNSHPANSELGPLARIPSPDPDHIDGLHKHPHSAHGTPQAAAAPSLPPLAFDLSMTFESPATTPTNATHNQNPLAPHPPEKPNAIFNHPNLNSSAPALSTMTNPPMLMHRAATTPGKRLAFANNLSVYDTFPASVYDRRSEPATWSRLTPALAQRIKEELNSYKMEEMEVHAASRIQWVHFSMSRYPN